MRRYLIFIVSLVLLAGSITTVFATRDARDYQLRGYVDATQTTDLPYRIPRFGVNADLFQYNDEALLQHLAWMEEAHVNWVRQFIYWDKFEPEEGNYQWDRLDTVIEALDDFPQLNLVPVFMNSPQWARQSEVVTAPPDDPKSIVPFLREFAARYGEAIDYYQVWDEPNLDDAWGLSHPRPAEYVALLAESYNAIHSADFNATVIAAALAPTREQGGENVADKLYLQMIYDLGAADYFDAAAGKPYGFDASPDDRTVNIDTLNFSRLILLREVMVANGDGNKSLWASNWGWNSLPENWRGNASIWGDTTANEHLDYTINALERAEREWTWLGGMILHHWQPTVEADHPQWGFAVIDQDNEPSSLWQILKDYQTPSVASNGLYHPRSEYAQYSGLWTFSERGADIGWLGTSDSQLDFEFYGSDLALLLREGDYFAFLYPTVDETIPNATAHDADGNGYLLLRSGSHQAELNMVAVSRELSLETHQLHVIADRGWDQWALAGYAVSSGDLAMPYNRQIQIAWLTTLSSLLATIVSGYFLNWKQIYARFYGVTSLLNEGLQLIITIATSIALMLGLLMSVGVPEPSLFRRDLVEQGLLILFTGGLIAIKLPMLVVIIAALVLFWLIYHHLEWGLLLVLLYAPFFDYPVELHLYAFPMSEFILLITVMAWLLRLFVQWGEERQSANSDYPLKMTIKWHPLDGLMIIWLVLGICAVLWSARADTAITELRTLFIEPFLFYTIMRTMNPDWKKIRFWVVGLVSAGIIVSVIGLVLYFTGRGVITAEGGARRLASVYGSPNNVGLLLGRIIPFVFAAVLMLRHQLRYLILVFVLLLATVVLTQSVGAILIGVPCGIAAVLVASYGKKSLPILAGLMIVGLIVTFALTQISTRFAGLLDMSSGTNFIRIRVWESSVEILQNHPMTGLGLDQFLYEFSGHYVRPDAIADPDLSHPHNIVLDFWIRLGFLGVIWLVTFMIVFWREVFKLLKGIQDLYPRTMIIGTIGAMTALIAHGMIDNSIYVNDLIYIFVFLVGIMVQFSHQMTSNR